MHQKLQIQLYLLIQVVVTLMKDRAPIVQHQSPIVQHQKSLPFILQTLVSFRLVIYHLVTHLLTLMLIQYLIVQMKAVFQLLCS